MSYLQLLATSVLSSLITGWTIWSIRVAFKIAQLQNREVIPDLTMDEIDELETTIVRWKDDGNMSANISAEDALRLIEAARAGLAPPRDTFDPLTPDEEFWPPCYPLSEETGPRVVELPQEVLEQLAAMQRRLDSIHAAVHQVNEKKPVGIMTLLGNQGKHSIPEELDDRTPIDDSLENRGKELWMAMQHDMAARRRESSGGFL
jgi:hypothetical protein